MPIVMRLDRVMADRKMSSIELAEKVGISPVNISRIKPVASRASASRRLRPCARRSAASPVTSSTGWTTTSTSLRLANYLTDECRLVFMRGGRIGDNINNKAKRVIRLIVALAVDASLRRGSMPHHARIPTPTRRSRTLTSTSIPTFTWVISSAQRF